MKTDSFTSCQERGCFTSCQGRNSFKHCHGLASTVERYYSPDIYQQRILKIKLNRQDFIISRTEGNSKVAYLSIANRGGKHRQINVRLFTIGTAVVSSHVEVNIDLYCIIFH